MAEQPNLKALPMDRAIALLKAARSQTASVERLEADREQGAPITADGLVNVLAYAAWLAKRFHGA